jgi:hypothetical protein
MLKQLIIYYDAGGAAMENYVDLIIQNMAVSHREMSQILDAKRQVSVRVANLISEIPSLNPSFETMDALLEHSLMITKNITAYLNSLADLEDGIVSNISLVVKELRPPTGDE